MESLKAILNGGQDVKLLSTPHRPNEQLYGHFTSNLQSVIAVNPKNRHVLFGRWICYLETLRKSTSESMRAPISLGQRPGMFSNVPVILFLRLEYLLSGSESEPELDQVVLDPVLYSMIGAHLRGILREFAPDDIGKCDVVVSVTGPISLEGTSKRLIEIRLQAPEFCIANDDASIFHNYLIQTLCKDLNNPQILNLLQNIVGGCVWKQMLSHPYRDQENSVPLFGLTTEGYFAYPKFIGLVNDLEITPLGCKHDDLSLADGLRIIREKFPFEFFKGKSIGRQCKNSDPNCEVDENSPWQLVYLFSLFASPVNDDEAIFLNIEDLSAIDMASEISLGWKSTVEERLHGYLALIDKRYWAESHHNWLALGNIIYNVHKAIDEENPGTWSSEQIRKRAIALWMEYGEEATDWVEEDYEKYYGYNPNHYSLATLAWILREVNPDGYDIIISNVVYEIICYLVENDRPRNDMQMTVAELFYHTNWLEFKTVPKGNRHSEWKKFVNGKWITVPDVAVPQLIAGSVRKILHQYINKYENNLPLHDDSKTAAEKEQGRATALEILRKYDSKLEKWEWTGRGLFKWLTGRLTDLNFPEKVDRNVNLMGMNNGYLECVGPNVNFRSGRPEDYVTIYSQINYGNYTWEHRDVQFFLEWMTKMYPSSELRDYVLKIFACSLFSRGNREKILPIMVSAGNILKVGNEGKTTLKTLIDRILGAHSVTPKSTLIAVNSNKSAENASPELSKGKDARILWLNELSAKIRIDDGTIKLLSGGGEIIATRKLHSNDDSYVAQFMPIIVCNTTPRFDVTDGALIKRIRLIPHHARWVDPENAPESEEEQRKQNTYVADSCFMEKHLNTMAPAALWVLVRYYERYIQEGLKTPREVQEFSQSYWRRSDIYYNYIDSNIELLPRDDSRLSISEVYNNFHAWCQSNNQRGIPDKSEFIRVFSLRIGREPENGYWEAIRFKAAALPDIWNQT